MSEYYKEKRIKNMFDPQDKEPFKLSRSKIELYLKCPRCFYLDRRLGIEQPPGFPFTLNSAVDTLLKKEFDLLRASRKQHPLMQKYGVDAIPAQHEKLNEWRKISKGVQYHHKPTNLLITGAIDDLWQNPVGAYIVVDYKATSQKEEIIALDQDWQDSYKRQMEIYQWLIRRNGLTVSNTGYFVYCNGNTDLEKFDGKLEFDITLIPYEGNDNWVESTISDIKKCLMSDSVPAHNKDCDYCRYCNERRKAEIK